MENSLLNVGREHAKGQEELKRGRVELCETSHLIAKQVAEKWPFFPSGFFWSGQGPRGTVWYVHHVVGSPIWKTKKLRAPQASLCGLFTWPLQDSSLETRAHKWRFDGVLWGHTASVAPPIKLHSATSSVLAAAVVAHFLPISREDNLDPIVGVRVAMPHFKNMWLLHAGTLGLWKSDLENVCLFITQSWGLSSAAHTYVPNWRYPSQDPLQAPTPCGSLAYNQEPLSSFRVLSRSLGYCLGFPTTVQVIVVPHVLPLRPSSFPQ